MSTQGVGTFLINSKFASGSLVFYEKGVGRTTTGDVFTIGTTAVKVGNTSQDVDFQYYGTGSLSAIIDCGAATFTLAGLAMSTNKTLTFSASADSAAVADTVTIGGYDISAGHRALAIGTEEVVAADTDETKFSHKLPVRINGATYNIMLTAT